jgi:biopolymer transport protein ExbD
VIGDPALLATDVGPVIDAEAAQHLLAYIEGVSVTKDGKIKINRDVVARAEFANKLRRVLAGSGQRTIFFDADDEAPFGTAVEAMDLARGGGSATIAVLTDALPKE